MSFNTNTDIWFAGAFAAFTVDLLVYPLDTLKTRIQSPNYKTLYKTIPEPTPSSSNTSSTAQPHLKPSRLTPSTLLSRHTHFNSSLFRGLYQGIGSVIFVTIPSSGAFFTTYEALKSSLSDSIPPNSTLYLPQPAIHALSSGGAELVSCAILTPAEVLKQNAQVWNGSRDGKRVGSSPTMEVLRQFRSQPTNLFRGYTALAARNLPFTGLQFPMFEHLKGYFLERRRRKKLQRRDDEERKGEVSKEEVEVDGILERAYITAFSAALAGTGAAWITTPIDVLKTRIMLAAGEETKHQEPKPNPHSLDRTSSPPAARQSALALTRQILQTEGVRGMFRGALLRSLWTAFGSGLYLGCYEAGRHYLEERRRGKDADGGGGGGGDALMQREKDWKAVKVGIGKSRSQGEVVGKSAWQD